MKEKKKKGDPASRNDLFKVTNSQGTVTQMQFCRPSIQLCCYYAAFTAMLIWIKNKIVKPTLDFLNTMPTSKHSCQKQKGVLRSP